MARMTQIGKAIADSVDTLGTDDTTIPTSKAVKDVTDLLAPVASPALTGDPTAPTPAVDDNDTSIATTAFIQNQKGIANPLMNDIADPGVSSRWTPIDHVHPSDTSRAATSHTHAESDVTNLVTDLAAKAPLASPALTGNPTAPTPAVNDNDTSIATTAFVIAQEEASTVPAMNGVADPGSSIKISKQDHVHPSDTTRAGVNTAAISLYVDSSASVSGNGLSWATAVKTIAEAIALIPTVVGNAVTVYIRAGTYNENIIPSKLDINTTTFRGEFYWHDTCAAAGTPANNKFRTVVESDGANIAAGDYVMVTHLYGAADANKNYVYTTVQSVSSIGGSVYEVTLTDAGDWGNIGASDAYTIVKTSITGAANINRTVGVNITGIRFVATNGLVGQEVSQYGTILYCFVEATGAPIVLRNQSVISNIQASYLYTSSTTAAGVSLDTTSSIIIGANPTGVGTNATVCVIKTSSTGASSGCVSALKGAYAYIARTILDASVGGIGIYCANGGNIGINACTVVSGSAYGIYSTADSSISWLSFNNNATIPNYGTTFWVNWTPTLVWNSATYPTCTVIARYNLNARVCSFYIDISSTDSNAKSLTSVTLPSGATPVDYNANIPVNAIEGAGTGGTTYTNPLAYIKADGTDNKINFRASTAGVDANAISYIISGCYEVAL